MLVSACSRRRRSPATATAPSASSSKSRPSSAARAPKRSTTASNIAPTRDPLGGEDQIALLRARDDEQVLGELNQAVDLGRRRRDRRPQLALVARVALGDLELGLVRGERGAQLVAGVVDEAALALERRLEPGERLVEGLAQPPELVGRRRDRQPLAGVGRGDRRRAPPHRLDGAQRGRGRAVAGERGQQQGDRAADQQQRGEPAEGLVAVAERGADGDHERLVVGLHRRREQAHLALEPRRGLVLEERGPRERALELGLREHRLPAELRRRVDDARRRA